MYLVWTNPTKSYTLMIILFEGWKKCNVITEQILSQGGRVEEKIYKGYEIFYFHKSKRDDPNVGENQKKYTTTVRTINGNLLWTCKYYLDYRHLRDISEEETNM